MQTRTGPKRLWVSPVAAAVSAILDTVVTPLPAFAQLQLEEIVVTARKREENLLEVPFAISAFTDQDLLKANLKDLTDLSLFSPGMTFQNATANRADRGTPNIIIRGLNLSSPSSSSDAALLFVDGAPVFGAEVGTFIDVERVEVLRGPQTAYFGRNTFSGAVNLVTKNPGNEMGGFVGIEYGSFGSSDLQASFESPLVEDVLAFRVSARRNEKGGQYTNNFNGKREIGEELTESLVGTVVWNISDNIELKVRGNYSEIEDGPSRAFRFGSGYANCDPNGDGRTNWRCGKAPSIDTAKAEIGWQNAFDPNYFGGINYQESVLNVLSLFSEADSPPRPAGRTRVDSGEGVFIDQMGLAKRIYGGNLQLQAALPGNVTFNWISAVSEIYAQIASDENTLPRDPAFPGLASVFIVDRSDENTSHELRFSSGSDQRLRWLAGANYIENESVGSCISAYFRGPSASTCRPIQEVNTFGVFGGLYYDLTETITASGELRWQNDEILVPGSDVTFQKDFKNVGGRVTLEYSPSDDINYFVNYASGFRPGGFNTIFANLNAQESASLTSNSGVGVNIDPETLDQFEIGVKGRFLDNRLSGSVVAYMGEITDQQQTTASNYTDRNGNNQLITVTDNIGVVGMHGIELEGAYQATAQLLLQGSFAWNYTEIEKGVDLGLANLGIISSPTAHEGNQLNWAPEYTASGVATYSLPLFGLDGFLRAEWIYEATKYATLANSFETGDRDLVNIRIGVDREPYRVEFFVTNLFDNDTYFNVTRQTDLDNFQPAFTGALPDRRALGLRAFLNF